MRTKFHHLLTPLLLGLATVSCEQNEVEEVTPTATAENISNATAPGVIFEELFEGSSPLSQSLVIDKATWAAPYSMQFTASPVFQGSKAARFELRDSDPEVASGTRTEVALAPASGRDRWYSFAAYFPADAWGYDEHAEIISQWHSFPDENLGEQWGSPATKMLIHQGRLRFDVGYNAAQVSSGVTAEKKFDMGEVPKDSWQEFVIHIYHSHNSDGIVEVWQNGKKVVEHKGANSYNDAKLPFWKFGIYKWGWNGSNTTGVSRRVLHVDNVRVGDGNASFASMSSGTSSTAPTETQPAPTEPKTGLITRQYWANNPGYLVTDIPLNSTPSNVSQLTKFEAPSNFADKYGQRIRGYVTAPTTGNYTFWIAADDHAELWLSTSEDPSKKVKVAQVQGWTAPLQWNKYGSQRSVSIRLEAGKRYYIEALHKEVGGPDNLAVGWRLPSGTLERPIPGNRLSPFVQ